MLCYVATARLHSFSMKMQIEFLTALCDATSKPASLSLDYTWSGSSMSMVKSLCDTEGLKAIRGQRLDAQSASGQ